MTSNTMAFFRMGFIDNRSDRISGDKPTVTAPLPGPGIEPLIAAFSGLPRAQRPPAPTHYTDATVIYYAFSEEGGN
jgi:hypothetical protein